MTVSRTLLSLLAVLALAPAARAEDDKAALQGLKDGKIVFDVTQGNGKDLLDRLQAIDGTRKELAAQGVTPHIVIAFRSGASVLVQKDPALAKPEDRPFMAEIQAKLAEMGKAPGIDSVEQCSAAAKRHKIASANYMPPIKVVGNSFISLMAYQAKGYAYIRP